MFNIDERHFMPCNDPTGHFPSEKPRYTMTEEVEHTVREMKNTIDRLLKFEKRLETKFEDMLKHLTSDNVLFKNTFAEAYNSFLMEVKNEVNVFEGNVDASMVLFQKTLESDYATLSEDCKTQITEYYNQFVAELNQYKADLNGVYDEFRDAIESRLTQYNDGYVEAFNNYTTQMNTKLSAMEKKFNQDYTNFVNQVTSSITEFTNEWTKTIEARLDGQDSVINDAVLYMKSNIIDTVESQVQMMFDNGDFATIIEGHVFRDFNTRLTALEKTGKNVRDYGAVGDGVTDDTVAIQNCFDNEEFIYFPDGEYLISSSITMSKENQRVQGLTMGATIKADEGLTAPMLIMDGTSTPAYRSNQEINNISFVGNGVCTGIRFNNNADFAVTRVKVTECAIGLENKDGLIYTVTDTTVSACTKGIVFRTADRVSSANNVKFRTCRIYACTENAIYSEMGASTHGVIFDGCEIEANNIDKVSDAAILLQSTFTSGDCPMVTFTGCWFENNRGLEAVVKITNPHTNYPSVIFTGNVILNDPDSVPKFIDAEHICLHISANHNPSTYSDIAIDLVNCRYFNFGCTIKHRTDEAQYSIVIGYDGKILTDLKIVDGKGVTFKSLGGTDTNRVFANSNNLRVEADKGSVVLFGEKGVDMGNSYLKPTRFGDIYMWAYDKTLYVKHGSAPTAYNDGTVLKTIS